ncbi:unnamed protein product [Adineta ricciae]|uniref:G-protein coupled receptors family 1 profile domain-containing protein n=1 Tax=Adineta ricciae TaxID=249248 RepID=A0A814JE12_ADIRI|nr:unnamed protein product [Adineta ricciae]
MMKCLSIVILWNLFFLSGSDISQPTYNLYNTDTMTSDVDHDCLYFSIINDPDIHERWAISQQDVEYCIRTKEEGVSDDNENAISSILPFDELKKRNITSENLLKWSAPIDTVEHYEHYLQTNRSTLFTQFYNCMLPWFGPFCQYRMISYRPFSHLIQMRLTDKQVHYKSTKITCYMHIQCNINPALLCLDWREVCDGKIDCLNGGEDEKDCFELEINRCEEHEYQCRNGMCIDKEFLLDGYVSANNMECLDGSDETGHRLLIPCSRDSSFSCEDIFSPRLTDFNCGDGTFLSVLISHNHMSCANERNRALNYLSDWHNPGSLHYPRCFKTLMCASNLRLLNNFDLYCKKLCNSSEECKLHTLQQCPSAFLAPDFPIWHSHVKYGYFSNQTIKKIGNLPHFVCYNETLCPHIASTFMLENSTCLHVNQSDPEAIDTVYDIFRSCDNTFQTGDEVSCTDSTMVRCAKTNRCIPKRRIMDGVVDCYHAFDESLSIDSCALNDQYRFPCTSEQKCLAPILVDDKKIHCNNREDETSLMGVARDIHKLPFIAFCDGKNDLLSVNNETEETHCEAWPCANAYTRCNQYWNCPNGIDEVNCSSVSSCPVNHHPCLLPHTHKMGCLHIDRVEDGIMDCLGATDEPSYCKAFDAGNKFLHYHCWNDTKCVSVSTACLYCHDINDVIVLCDKSNPVNVAFFHYFAERDFAGATLMLKAQFSHKSSSVYPSIQLPSTVHKQISSNMITTEKTSRIQLLNDSRLWLCNKGLVILVGKNETKQCLCPETYYGNHCQYQNQRVSLTLRLHQEKLFKFTVIGIIIRLVDTTGFIQSYEQITYVPVTHCNAKYNMYLLYHHRPKNTTENYTIYIDAYDKVDLLYLTSWIYPVKLKFMPVNRMSVQLIIPAKQDCRLVCSEKYFELLRNDRRQSCRCVSRIQATVDKCSCSSESICVGMKENRSICLCPLHKTGPRCYLNSICETNNSCVNKGICVPHDSRHSPTNYTCVCPDGFFGKYCEQTDVKINVSISGIEAPQSALIHFIDVAQSTSTRIEPDVTQTTIFKRIGINENVLILNMSLSFHLLFVQFEHSYYLAVLQHDYVPSVVILSEISPSRRCPVTHELMDSTILAYSVVRRVKHYHSICQQYAKLDCFHDNYTFMCLCTNGREANCFHFNYNTTYKCSGHSNCENGARCFQDHPHCPTKTMCVCQECFYGDKCQFTSHHFGLSLDSILGYHIYPHLTFTEQSLPLKISITLSTIIVIIGFISGILSNLTFQVKLTRQTGCGVYLFASSMTSIMIVLLLYVKVWLLIISQMQILTWRFILFFNCTPVEFLLRLLLTTTDWYHVFVTIERFLVVFLGVRFDKAKSRAFAKTLVLISPVLVAASILHDPIHRHLIDDVEDQRTWCIVTFAFQTETYNRFINIFHFIIPFSLNLILTIGIIFITARQRSSAKRQFTFEQHLKSQFYRHKHLIVSSILLIVFILPRLIISFLSNCMKSAKDYKLFLVSYFISFVPPILHFFIFVLTSEIYKKQFNAMIRRKWKKYRHCLFPRLVPPRRQK